MSQQSALTPRGSTRAWRTLRAHWADRITHAANTGNPIRCWRCHRAILPGQPWDLGHRTDRADGGTDADTAPEHPHCNRRAGAQRQRPRVRNW